MFENPHDGRFEGDWTSTSSREVKRQSADSVEVQATSSMPIASEGPMANSRNRITPRPGKPTALMGGKRNLSPGLALLLALVVGDSDLCGARGRVTRAIYAGDRDRVDPAGAIAAALRPQLDVMGVHNDPIRSRVPVSSAIDRLVAGDG